MATPKKIVGTKAKVETVEEVKEVIEEKVAEKKEIKRAVVNRHDIVRVTNCSNAHVYFTSYSGFMIELPMNGTSVNITVEQLQEIANKARGVLQRFEIVPVEVISGDFELEDLYNYVGIAHLDIVPEIDYIERLVLNTKVDELKSILTAKKQEFKEAVLSKAIELFNNGDLNDFTKLNFFREFTGNHLLFENLQ